jgi:hypothetical protein
VRKLKDLVGRWWKLVCSNECGAQIEFICVLVRVCSVKHKVSSRPNEVRPKAEARDVAAVVSKVFGGSAGKLPRDSA